MYDEFKQAVIDAVQKAEGFGQQVKAAAQHGLGYIAQDAAKGAEIMGDPRMNAIGMGPEAAIMGKGLGLLAGTLKGWKTTHLPQDLDLFQSMARAKVDPTIRMVPTKDLGYGHAMDSPEAQASIAKYVKQLTENPEGVPAIIRERLPNGTYQVPSGNGRLGAARQLGYEEIPAVDFQLGE